MGNQDGSPTMKDYWDTLVVFLSSLVKDSWVTQEGPPDFPGRGPLDLPVSPGGGLPGSLGWGYFGPPGSLSGSLLGPLDPPEGGSLGTPGDSGSQDPPRHSFIWQSGLTLDQSIADMNTSVMQLLAANRQPLCNYSYKHSRIRLYR